MNPFNYQDRTVANILGAMKDLILRGEDTQAMTPVVKEQIQNYFHWALMQGGEGGDPFFGVQQTDHPLRLNFVTGLNSLFLAKQVFAEIPSLVRENGASTLPVLARVMLLAKDHEEVSRLDLSDRNYSRQLAGVSGSELAVSIELLVSVFKMKQNGSPVQPRSKVVDLLIEICLNNQDQVKALGLENQTRDVLRSCEALLFREYVTELASKIRSGSTTNLQHLKKALEGLGAIQRSLESILDQAAGEKGMLPPLAGSIQGRILMNISTILYRTNNESGLAHYAETWCGGRPGRKLVLAILRRDFRELETLSHDDEAELTPVFQNQIATLGALELAVRDSSLDGEFDMYWDNSRAIHNRLFSESEISNCLESEFSAAKEALLIELVQLAGEESTKRHKRLVERLDSLQVKEAESEEPSEISDFFPAYGDVLLSKWAGQTHESFPEARQILSDNLLEQYESKLSQEDGSELKRRLKNYVDQARLPVINESEQKDLVSIVLYAHKINGRLPKLPDDINTNSDSCNRSPMFVAAMLGNTQLIKDLRTYNISRDTIDSQGVTPLMTACRSEFSAQAIGDTIKTYLAGTDINKLDRLGYSALHHALISGRIHAVRALVQAGARFSPTPMNNISPVSALWCALAASKSQFARTDFQWILTQLSNEGVDLGNEFKRLPAGSKSIIATIVSDQTIWILRSFQEALRLGGLGSIGVLVDHTTLLQCFTSLLSTSSQGRDGKIQMLRDILNSGLGMKAFGTNAKSDFIPNLVHIFNLKQASNFRNDSAETQQKIISLISDYLVLEKSLFGDKSSIYGSNQFGQPYFEVLVRNRSLGDLAQVCLGIFFNESNVSEMYNKAIRRSARAVMISVPPLPKRAFGLLSKSHTDSEDELAKELAFQLQLCDGDEVKGINNKENQKIMWLAGCLPAISFDSVDSSVVIIAPDTKLQYPHDPVACMRDYLRDGMLPTLTNSGIFDHKGVLLYLRELILEA